jgi:flagellar basal body rod protein FlgG
MESLEVLANNIANTSTGGFKADREFYSLYVAPELEADSNGTTNGTLPVVEQQWTDFAQGSLLPTGNQYDVALNGAGFVAVNSPNGPLYTRNGNFKLSDSGQLVTGDGYAVRLSGGQTLQIRTNDPVEIQKDGTITQSGQPLGQLDVVDFDDHSVLTKQGSSYFRSTDAKLQPKPARNTQVEQGKLEGSNSSAAESSIRLVGLMRQFEMLQKVAMIDNDMSKKTIEEVARVGS